MKTSKGHLGQRIKRLRAYRGLTQEDLAEALGKTRSLVSFLERTGNINKYTLQEIAKALAIPVDQLNDDTTSASAEHYGSEINQKSGVIEQLKKENEFLKDTIQHQWDLIKALSEKSRR